LEKIEESNYPIDYRKINNCCFSCFQGRYHHISRDINYFTDYQEGFDNDSIVLKKQKFIRIVRNEEERGISIKLRGRKNARPLREKEGKIPVPIVD
jgi:hypothetical protein